MLTGKLKRLTTAAIVAGALLCAVAQAHAATTLNPDLQVLPPRDLRLDRVDVTGGDTGASGTHDVLRFSNTVWNSGPGELVVRATPGQDGQHYPAYQRVYDSAGGFADRQAGTVVFHQQHDHYHYEGWGLYQLWTKADYDAWVAGGRGATPAAQTGAKTTSCILDQEFIGGPGTRWPHTYGFGGCLLNGSGQLVEGLSPGWGDTYSAWRYDQWIVLSAPLANGQYVLRSVVNPSGQLQETSTANNDEVRAFTVSNGQIVDSQPPSGTVTLNDVDTETDNPIVTLKVLGRDDVGGVDSFQVSSDGSHWSNSIPYEGHDSTPHSIRWNLADAAYGGTAALGTKTVYVRLHDRSGKTATLSHSIDLVAPRPGTPYSRAVRADNPISHWRFDESSAAFPARDEVGGNNGAYGGSPAVGSAGLIASDPDHTAALYRGQDYAYFSHTSAQDLTTDMTLEAWIAPTAFPGQNEFASVVSKPDSYSLQFFGSQLEFTVIPAPGERERLRLAPGAIPLGRASHVVGTYDGTTQRLYVNGVQVASRPLTRPAQVANTETTIGAWQFGVSEFFTGTIDEVAIYPTALSPARVRAHYDVAQGPPQPPPAPQNLAAAGVPPSRIDLSWAPTSHEESSFVLQRATESTFASPVSIDVAENRVAYADTGLEPSRRYWYRIRALNPVGASGWSNVASASTASGAGGPNQRPSDAAQQTGRAPNAAATRPVASIVVGRQSLEAVLRRGLSLRITCDSRGSASTRLLVAPSALGRRGRGVQIVVGRVTTRLSRAGTTTVVVKLTPSARRLLARRRSARLRVETTVTDAAGRRGTARPITVLVRSRRR